MRMPLTGTGERSGPPDQAGASAGLAGSPAELDARRPAGPLARGRAALTQHWLFTIFLTAGLAMRVITQLAYQPAILYIDSVKYLLNAYPGDDPPGYLLVLKPVLAVGNLAVVAGLQHVAGLAMAVALYLLVLRRGAPRWLAALATLPVLLDAYQLQIEQNIMPDTLFETLIVVGLAALLWHPRPRAWQVVVAGLALGSSAPVREMGEIFILPALLYLLIAVRGWRPRAGLAVLLCATFAFPVMFVSYKDYLTPLTPHHLHYFSLAPFASETIYGRMADAADCATLRLPSYERPLCPSPALQRELGPDGLDHSSTPGEKSPLKPFQNYVLPHGLHRNQVVSNFTRRVAEQQPLRVVESVARAAITLFAVDRQTSPGDTPISRWEFTRTFRPYKPYVYTQHRDLILGDFDTHGVPRVLGTGEQFGDAKPIVSRTLGSFLRTYQLDGGFTPGPLLLVMTLAGLMGSLAVPRRRLTPGRRATALACLLFFTTGVCALLASDVFEFSWRYQLPALITLPPAAALAFTLVLRGRAERAAAAGQAGAGSVEAAGQQVPPDMLEAD